jgi:hypothetical protein
MSNYPYEIPPDKIWRRDNPYQDNLSYESVIETNKVKPPGGISRRERLPENREVKKIKGFLTERKLRIA